MRMREVMVQGIGISWLSKQVRWGAGFVCTTNSHQFWVRRQTGLLSDLQTDGVIHAIILMIML